MEFFQYRVNPPRRTPSTSFHIFGIGMTQFKPLAYPLIILIFYLSIFVLPSFKKILTIDRYIYIPEDMLGVVVPKPNSNIKTKAVFAKIMMI